MINDRTNDMTSGQPLQLIIRFAIPIFLGNLFQQFYSVADAMVLGRLIGVDALAAAGSTNAVSSLVLGFIIGLTYGYSILISQRFGAGDHSGLRRAAANAGYLAAAVSLLATVLSLLGSRPLLNVMHTPADILDDALLYIRVIFIGITATMFYNMFSCILRALGDSASPQVILVISSLVNVGLDILFVGTFHWGVAGAAWATVLAQALSGVMCFLVLRRLELMRFQPEDWRPERAVILELLRLGLPSGLLQAIMSIGIMMLQSVVNGLGSVTVAAYTAGSKIMNLALQPGDIIGMALGTYVGQNLGAGQLDRIKTGVRQTVVLSLAVNAAMGAALILFGRQLTAVFVSGAELEVIDAAYPYFVITGAGVWIVGLLFLYRFALQSLGNAVIPMISGAVELAMRVGTVLLLARCFDFGFYAVCWAEVAAWTGAAILLAAGYYAKMAKLRRQKTISV